MKRLLSLIFVIALSVLFGRSDIAAAERVISSASGGRVKSLDPALADDLASRNLTAAIFDTLLEYDYIARPYKLKPSMLAEMPVANADFTRYDFKLRDDLYFTDAPEFPLPPKERKITSSDIKFSFLRIADSRNHSPVYWMFRSKIAGFDQFNADSARLQGGDYSIYDREIAGFQIKDDLNFSIILERPDPRFLYILAMPNAGIVPRKILQQKGGDFAFSPVGSGAFILEKWIPDYRISLIRNPDYRKEFFSGAENPDDRQRPLPLADRVEIKLIKQPMTSWLLFLQGGIDFNAVDKENLDFVSGSGGELSPVLQKRRIRLLRLPEFEIRYIGFNFNDPQLGSNLHLRRALSLAFNVGRRINFFGGQMLRANTIIPPGVAGHDEKFHNRFSDDDYEAAAKELAKAGFPGGIDPVSGKHLSFTFDQGGNTSACRQLGELMAKDLEAIGVEVESILNNNPRFYEKLRRSKFQLFRLSWVGDYPDAENFLQLFYSGNITSCNRTGFCDAEYDRLYEKILTMPDCPERSEIYRQMAEIIADKCVWIMEGFPISWLLYHSWLENYVPGDFAFNFYKYLSVDPDRRETAKKSFRPLSFGELQRKN